MGSLSFKQGDQVEVCCKDEGFENSYYQATIISQINNTNDYIVQYNTLLTADKQHPHREFISAVDLRPVPPEIMINNKYDLKDEVDVYANDGWWKGNIKKKFHGKGRATRYYVSFESNNGVEFEVGKYWFNDLRIHQDWVNGKWSCSKKNFD